MGRLAVDRSFQGQGLGGALLADALERTAHAEIAADGGTDVRIELPADTEISGFIPRPVTGFQAKADDIPAS